ncbi:hypothetical protein ACIO6T_26200 [Streptomyces sp. NPDC087532]|uniref:hypothetical protein n=1 Tax=Streptomyces sp. NPDC087532 TaxID=3365795 RepID=UPI003830F48E
MDAVPADPGVRARMLTARHALSTTDDGNVVLTAGGESWTFTAPALPLLKRLADRSEHRLADLVSDTELTLGQAAAVISELLNGQVASVRGTQ